MRARNLFVLAAIAILLLAVAWYAQRSRPAARSDVASAGEPFLSGLLDRVNEVRRIELRKGGEKLVLERSEEGWIAPEHAGYPVKTEQVRQLLLQVARLQTVERKTSNPALLARLELEDPDAGDARSGRLDLWGEGEEPLASLIVGKMNWGRRKSVYVRRPDEDQAWLCRGELRVETSTSIWMDRQVASLETDRVQWVEVRHPDGEVLRIHREAKGGDFTVDGVPEGRELRTPRAGDQVAGALSWVSFDEVQRAGDFQPSGDTVVTLFHCFDGLEVQVESWEAEDGKVWCRFRALAPPAEEAADEAAEDAAGEAEEAVPEEETGAPEQEEEAEETSQEKTPGEQAEEWNGKWQSWVFALPSYKAEVLRRHLEDLLQEPETAPEEEAPATPEGGDQEEPGEESGS